MVNPKDVLVDVIGLSKQLCAVPIEGELAYATKENFLGRVVDGYHPDALEVCLLTRKAAEQLCDVQNEVVKQGLGLFVFDAFRPLRAVKNFSSWYREPLNNDFEKERKQVHFPHLKKEDLVRLGYAPETISRHNFGGAVDLSLMRLEDKQFLDMGTVFDFFDSSSHLDAKAEIIGEEALQNRELLVNVMESFDFLPYPFEWWHFEYHKQEVADPMDMEITPDLKGLGLSKCLQ